MSFSNHKILATKSKELFVLTPTQQKSIKTFAKDIQAGKFGNIDPNNFNPGEN